MFLKVHDLLGFVAVFVSWVIAMYLFVAIAICVGKIHDEENPTLGFILYSAWESLLWGKIFFKHHNY
jgi:hypothetical protein